MKKHSKEQTIKRREFIQKSISEGMEEALSAFYNESVQPTGEKVRLLSVDGQLVEIDKAFLKPVPDFALASNGDRAGIPGRRFVMVIDLANCKNLRKCHDACEHSHHLSEEMEWLKVLKLQDNEIATPYWQPTPCFHCDVPPCVKVCPVDATYKRSDGLVLIDADRCIGCRFCMVACPYSARTFQWDEPELPESVADQHHSHETSMPLQMGTVSKCDFCPDMVKEGELPHCVTACPNGVFYFGDENEDSVTNGAVTVRLSELLRDRAGYRYLEDLGTKPRVYYLPPVNRAFPFEDDEYTKKGEGEH